MAPFVGLGRRDIHLVSTPRQAEAALDDLVHQPLLGFDTESKPTFRKGEKSLGPHVLQFATLKSAYIFQTCHDFCGPAVAKILESKQIAKVGFGLDNDIPRIAGKLQIRPRSIIDLNHLFEKRLGRGNSIGVRTAIALLFNRRFIKPHKATTSNWSNRILTEKQLLYAANDAFGAIVVYTALKKQECSAKQITIQFYGLPQRSIG